MEPQRNEVSEEASPGRLPARMESALSPRAQRQAPTLMGGEVAGGQGAVQVWAPADHRFLTLLLAYSALSLAISVAPFLIPFMHYPWQGPLFGAALWLVALADILPALWKRRYFTTDDAGIGITTWRGTRAFRWDQIALYCDSSRGGVTLLFTTQGERIKLNFYGYTSNTRMELRHLIWQRAGLERVKDARKYRFPIHRMFLRPGARVRGFGLFAKVTTPPTPALQTRSLPPSEAPALNADPKTIDERGNGELN